MTRVKFKLPFFLAFHFISRIISKIWECVLPRASGHWADEKVVNSGDIISTGAQGRRRLYEAAECFFENGKTQTHKNTKTKRAIQKYKKDRDPKKLECQSTGTGVRCSRRQCRLQGCRAPRSLQAKQGKGCSRNQSKPRQGYAVVKAKQCSSKPAVLLQPVCIQLQTVWYDVCILMSSSNDLVMVAANCSCKQSKARPRLQSFCSQSIYTQLQPVWWDVCILMKEQHRWPCLDYCKLQLQAEQGKCLFVWMQPVSLYISVADSVVMKSAHMLLINFQPRLLQ